MAVAKAVELQPAALAEAEEAVVWYAERDSRVAGAFVAELEAALERIAEAPGRWPAHQHGTQRVRLARFPYLVVYRDEPERVLVVAVAHAKRRPGYWRKR
ncbi:type II toxin-antitoxin system RelE/ParE family toxin [Sorangium sp. So ce448]|uniref:type II toxin-antitoxin system RelE/ParE family toxin n=1 Tax=Sorangium sp. So ce448 TaxID=3133314 RepID=UPI003F5FBE79